MEICEETERAGTVSAWIREGWTWGRIVPTCTKLKGLCKWGEAKFHLATGLEAMALKEKRFPLDIRKHFLTVRVTKHHHWLLMEMVESSCLEILKICLDTAMGNLL